MFPPPGDPVPTDPRAVVRSAARDLLRTLADRPDPLPLRLVEADGRIACLILVWAAGGAMPVARRPGCRDACRRDILAALRAAGRPLTRKQLVKALRGAKAGHGPGTVAKALADLTNTGELVNTRDKRGYRLPDWVRRDDTPSLFD